MTAGQRPDPTGEVGRHDNWVQAFFNVPVLDEPGTRFLYNSAATYMLSAIVQKVTGQKTLDYLKPRLLDPLGITGADSEVDPSGIHTGGWGLRFKTEDMAKLGQLFLQKGLWKGRQVLPASWVEEATSVKIMQDPSAPQPQRDSSEWLQGYCYQMWRSRHNSYRADGAYGQYILVLPDADVVIAITSETHDMQDELNLVWKHLLPAFKPGKLAPDARAQKELRTRLAALALPNDKGIANEDLEKSISGKEYAIVSADRMLRSFRFDFNGGLCRLTCTTDSLIHDFEFGAGRWVSGETAKFGIVAQQHEV
jgi:CubicO group peptidase (beta-lactamase class C family)